MELIIVLVVIILIVKFKSANIKFRERFFNYIYNYFY